MMSAALSQFSPASPAEAPPGPAEIRLTNVVKHFGQIGAANGVSLELQKGELMALVGPSGCGKTTTLRLIAGFERVDAGEIEINGALVAGPGLHLPPEQRRVGMVFQEYALFPHLTVAKNVAFGLHRYAGNRQRRTAEVLDLVGLSGIGERMPHELSGGQQQRVALARALAPEPDLVLLDEPFSNLDTGLRVRVRSEVRSILKQAHTTAIFVTHDQEEALSLVDNVAVMLGGIVHQVSTPHQLYWHPVDRATAAFVGDANFLPGEARGHRVSCEAGELETVTSLQGPVDVLIRPEIVEILPAVAEAQGRVHSILFFGHDQLVTIELASGTLLDARLGPMAHYRVGQPVQIRVQAPVITYPRA